MNHLDPSMRLKVKGDTFFLSDPNDGVYFRNNIGSFRLEGTSIQQWVEMLMPVFDGQHSLADLADGLPELYQNRIYEIADVLYNNGFVKDVSKEHPHLLSEAILQTYAPQIEFINSFTDSGAYRFQVYRQTEPIVIGSGGMLVSLVSALLEAGLPKLYVVQTKPSTDNNNKLQDVVELACKRDPEVDVKVNLHPNLDSNILRQTVRPFDAVLYVSEQGDIEQLRMLNEVCRDENKLFIPATSVGQLGIAGPVVLPDSEGCWESAWRRMHQTCLTKDLQTLPISPTAGALLANIIVFELLKTITGVNGSGSPAFYLLDLETLEGNWHSFLPHPLVTGLRPVEDRIDVDPLLLVPSNHDDQTSASLLPYFDRLTSKESGIFHSWEEGDLQQLPLAQCRIEVMNPRSQGPAETMPAIVCSGMTHEEARREAGLEGIEAYVTYLLDLIDTNRSSRFEDADSVSNLTCMNVGAGQTHVEAVSRGLQKCLMKEFQEHLKSAKPSVRLIKLERVEDLHCQFYLQALTTMQGELRIGFGEEVTGFPTVWVGTSTGWYGGIGLQVTLALRNALQEALQSAQNQAGCMRKLALQIGSVNHTEQDPKRIVIPSCEESDQAQIVSSSLTHLKQQGKNLILFDLALEPFLEEELGGVLGLLLRGEEPK